MSECLRLLLVEDSVRDAHLLRAQIKNITGGQLIELQHVQSLAEAVKALGEPHDCVLLDMNLSDGAELEGVDLIRRLAPSLPIVVLTGLEDEQLAQRALRHGAQEYLVKGHHDGDALVRRVQHAITRHRLMVDLEQQRQRDYHRASHDPLTGLPNRPLFLDRLKTAVAQAQRHRSMVVVGFLDLDGFKTVNDRYGHALGDALLCRVANVLSECLRAGDTVARLGGDEFVLLLTQPHNAQEAGVAASRILSALTTITEIDGQPVTIGGSLGLALFSDQTLDTSSESAQRPETLLLQADHAMYHAKAAGKGQWRLHGETHAMPHAIGPWRHDQLQLSLQPWYELRTRRCAGLEVCVRLAHEKSGAEPVLRAAGDELPALGHWVLTEAFRLWNGWFARGIAPPCLAINVAAAELEQRDYAETTLRLLKSMAVPTPVLQLEISEDVLGAAEHDGTLMRNLRTLRQQGVHAALDQFGRRQAALAAIADWPVNVIKVDRRCVHALRDTPHQSTLLAGIAAYAQALGHELIFCGVETDDDLANLAPFIAAMAQGYGLQKPMSAREFDAHLATV